MVNRLTDLYFRMVLTGIWSRGWTAVSPKYSVPVIKAFRRCLALLIVPSKSNSRIRKIGSRSSFSGQMALNHRPVFPDKKVIICVLCLIQFVNYSTRNAVVYLTEKKVVFCWLFQLLCKPQPGTLSLEFTDLKLHEVRLLNKCSKIGVILNVDSLQCF